MRRGVHEPEKSYARPDEPQARPGPIGLLKYQARFGPMGPDRA